MGPIPSDGGAGLASVLSPIWPGFGKRCYHHRSGGGWGVFGAALRDGGAQAAFATLFPMAAYDPSALDYRPGQRGDDERKSRFRNLSVRLRRTPLALEGSDGRFCWPASMTAVFGPNGAGKSSLLKAASPELFRPMTGQVSCAAFLGAPSPWAYLPQQARIRPAGFSGSRSANSSRSADWAKNFGSVSRCRHHGLPLVSMRAGSRRSALKALIDRHNRRTLRRSIPAGTIRATGFLQERRTFLFAR